MRVGMVFDLHVTEGQRRPYDGFERAKRGLQILNDRNVDWTLVGGDLRSFASKNAERVGPWGEWAGDPDNPYFRRDFERVRRLLDDHLDSPYRVIRGNHDRPLSVFRETFPPEEFPRWDAVREGGVRFVFLDSSPSEGYHSLYQTQNFVTAPQLSMLDRLMDRDPTVPTFVFCHAPLAPFRSLDPDWETGRTAAYRFTLNYPAVQRRLERGDAVVVNCGHYSPDRGRATTRVNGVTHVIARHFGKSDPDYDGDVRWMDVDADGGEAVVRYYDLSTDETGVITRVEW
ncbi:MAG: metallophosphoesterase [Haloarculaceae archaeon]